VSFTDNVVGMGLTAEDCGIVNNSRLTVTFIVDEVIRPPVNLPVMMRADIVFFVCDSMVGDKLADLFTDLFTGCEVLGSLVTV